ncbi:DNA gyrase subunit B [Candidatus Nanosynbacter lyticus]|uniref:DNA topoisomerase (ATP-hydrolyzing) n=1 Tax=Candidatus Nanosynbacter lyticus TaxID=2093824 RepID=A0A6S4GQB6_9BACT|nr:DNA topoisomerase subunit B [Candidatus Nanosynbacter lyticus]AJA06323.1 DNA gyrase subunit B [Candidatus Nanosynbacter lyticus]QCT41284.1 type IIA DNA topoisomerase subunit B [TM7 phylum sp. oral taxon 952]
MAKQTNEQSYDGSQIQVLEGLEPVRKRPGMYIGSTGYDGVHHLIKEIADNSIDEAIAGYATKVEVTLLEDGGVRISDDGRGIPVDKHPKTGKSTLETVLTILHAGGKFGGGGYKVSSGLHGVGSSVVNALSTRMIAEVRKNGKVYRQEYATGVPQTDLDVVGKSDNSGTTITFYPDPTIFKETVSFDYKWVVNYLRHQAYLTKGVYTSVVDERTGERKAFYFEGGIKSYVKNLNIGKEVLSEDIFYVEKQVEDCMVEIAVQYNDTYVEVVKPFANNVLTPDGGTHLVGFRAALTRVINDYARKNNLLKEKEDNLTGDDIREGLTAVILVKLPDPQFEGQTKNKLGNPEMRRYVDQVMSEYFAYYLEENPATAKKVVGKATLAARARKAARAARDNVIRKGAFEGLNLPSKLTDCSSRNRKDCELFIVEGNSAAGSAKDGRDSTIQAILPLRGKVLNTERARFDKMFANAEIVSLIKAMGVGIGDQFDISGIRYDKIIFMTDADVDGAHISTLLMTFFFRYMSEVIEAGHVYLAKPPLFGLSKGTGSNRKIDYVYDEAALEEKLTEKINERKAAGVKIDENAERFKQAGYTAQQRFKGLGEMDASQLWETTMNPENRTLVKVNIEDAERADAIFTKLMGDSVELRKNFIQTNAAKVNVEDLDF